MKYCNTLIAVKNMDQSLAFYKNIFNQNVKTDLGWCKTLDCGLTLQINFYQIAGFDKEKMKYRNYTMELYFETEDFDAFIALLEKHPEIEKVHEPTTYPWGQRGVHIFDPNGHIIEVGESMYSIATRYFKEGKSISEVASLIEFPLKDVEEWNKIYLSENK